MDDRTQHPTRTLLDEATRGDTPAVEELLVRYLPGLRAYIRLRAGPAVRAREAVSDVAQSVCREILGNVGRFRYGGEAGFKLWLFTTALRRIQNKDEHHRAQKRDVAREARPRAEQSGADLAALLETYRTFSSPSRRAIGRDELARIEAAFDRLGDAQREVIVMSRLMGLSHAEIGEQLGKSATATRSVLHRGLARLAEILDEGEA